MSELEFLGALEVELLRHRELHPAQHEHELFQTSTVRALLGGAYDGDVTLAEVLEQGDLGLGTLNGLDGELIVLMGFCFPDALDGIEMVGWHLHFIDQTRTRGGHVLSYTLIAASAQLDRATALHVELPRAVAPPRHGDSLDQTTLHGIESDR